MPRKNSGITHSLLLGPYLVQKVRRRDLLSGFIDRIFKIASCTGHTLGRMFVLSFFQVFLDQALDSFFFFWSAFESGLQQNLVFILESALPVAKLKKIPVDSDIISRLEKDMCFLNKISDLLVKSTCIPKNSAAYSSGDTGEKL